MPIMLNCSQSPRSLTVLRGISWVRAFVVAVAVLSAPCAFSQQNPCSSQPCPNAAVEAKKYPLPDANDQMEMQQQQTEKNNFEAANLERERQLTEETAMLLKLAGELKAEVDTSSQGKLSLSVIRQVEDIERLAHNVQVKMKLTIVSATN